MLNKVILAGRITVHPELKYTSSGIPATSFSVALNKGDKGAGFFNVTAWRSTAEFICRYFHKGDGICIDGHLASRTYEKNGVTRTVYEVVADSVGFSEGSNKDNQESKLSQEINASQNANFASQNAEPNFTEIEDDGDLPF